MVTCLSSCFPLPPEYGPVPELLCAGLLQAAMVAMVATIAIQATVKQAHWNQVTHAMAFLLLPAHQAIGLLSSSGRNAIIFSIVAYSAYKFAPEAGPDSQITRFLSSFSTPSETWREINAKHTALTAQSAENVKFIQTTKRPQIHRLQYPQCVSNMTKWSFAK